MLLWRASLVQRIWSERSRAITDTPSTRRVDAVNPEDQQGEILGIRSVLSTSNWEIAKRVGKMHVDYQQ